MEPKLVFIDDHVDELTVLSDLVERQGASSSKVYSPVDVDNDLLADTDLVIVDYSLRRLDRK